MCTDWSAWHDDYHDPRSALSRRLAFVQGHVRDVLNSTTGPITITSACAGDGRDVLDVLLEQDNAARAKVTLIEFDDRNISRAQERIERNRLPGMEIRQADAGNTSSYLGAVPADLLLMCGVMGNIVDDDIARLVAALPGMCRPGTVVLWTRTRQPPDLTGQIRTWFQESNFAEESFTAPDGVLFSVGRHRFAGEPSPLVPGQQLFSFVR